MYENLINHGYLYIIFTIIILFLFRNFLISFFDPLLFILLAISSSLAISTKNYFFFYVLLCTLAFFLSFYLIGKPIKIEKKINNFKNTNLLKIFTHLYFIIFIVLNIFLYYKSGIPILSKNPTLNKTSIYNDGLGIIRRINFSSNFLTICVLLSLISSKNKKIFFFLLIQIAIITILSGSKSGLLNFVLILWYFIQIENLWVSYQLLKLKQLIKSTIKYLLTLSILIFVSISIIESRQEGNNALISILFRLMEFGDVMIYYSLEYVRNHFSNFGILDFFRYELNGISGMLRLDTYLEPLGYQFVKVYWSKDNLFNGTILGPNALFFVKGHVFFGYIGGILYSFIIGFIVAFLRKKILLSNTKNIFTLALLTYLFFTLPIFLKEFSLGLSMSIDFVIFLTPIFLFSLFIDERLKQFKKNKKINV